MGTQCCSTLKPQAGTKRRAAGACARQCGGGGASDGCDEGERLTVSLQHAKKLASGHVLDLGDSVRITKDHTDLRRGEALLGQAADVLADLLRSDLKPLRRSALVRQSRLGNTLTVRGGTGQTVAAT